jgi:hypothetical protein
MSMQVRYGGTLGMAGMIDPSATVILLQPFSRPY